MESLTWKRIRDEWESNPKVTYRQLQDKYGIKASTIRSRRSREDWQRVATQHATDADVATQTEEEQVLQEEMAKMPDTLNDRQKLFCIYYLQSFNQTRAYQKAFNVKYLTARNNAYKLMQNTNVRREIERLKREQTTALHLDAQDVLQKYIDIAFADVTDYVDYGVEEYTDENGRRQTRNYVRFNDPDNVDGTIISKVAQGREGISVELADRMKALDMLSKYFDLLSDKDRQRLAQEKLQAEIDLIKKQLDAQGDDEGQTIIVTGEDQMRAYIEEQRKKKQATEEEST